MNVKNISEMNATYTENQNRTTSILDGEGNQNFLESVQ